MNVTLPINESPALFLDSTLSQIIKYLLTEADLYEQFKDAINLVTDYRAPLSARDANGNAYLPSKEEVRCTVRVTYNPQNLPWEVPYYSAAGGINPYRSTTTQPVIYDPTLGITAVMCGEPIGITMELVFRSHSLSTILGIQGAMKRRFMHGDMIANPSFAYQYVPPTELFGIVLGLIKLAGFTSADLVKYLHAQSDHQVELGINTDVTKLRTLLVKYAIRDLACKLEPMSDAPEITKANQQIESVSIGYTVTTQLTKPGVMVLTYPPVVKNNLVPEELIFFKAPDETAQGYRRHPNMVIDRCMYNHRVQQTSFVTVHFPEYDDWVPLSNAMTYALQHIPLVVQLFLLENLEVEGGTTTLDLRDVADGLIASDLLAEIIATGAGLFYLREYWGLTIYAGEVAVEPTTLSIVDGVITVPCRDIDKVYRLVLSVNKGALNDATNTSLRILQSLIVAARN